MDINALLDYWMDAEWWEIPTLKQDKAVFPNKFPVINPMQNNKTIRLFLGCHKAGYAVSGYRRNIRNVPCSFLVSLLISWTFVREKGKSFYVITLSKPHTYINRAALMVKVQTANKLPAATRDDVSEFVNYIDGACVNYFSRYNSRESAELNLQFLIQNLNDQLVAFLFPDSLPEGIMPTVVDKQSLTYTWREGSIDESPEQFGPFFQSDMTMAQKAARLGALSEPLKTFLSGQPLEKIELVTKDADLSHPWLGADSLPLGRWPANPKHGLTYWQYIALQAGRKNPGIQAVNGPPGTGKTTLLKDLIADRFVERTKKLIERIENNQNNLTAAFNLEGGKDTLPLIQEVLDYSIVVASANNKAVENISKELPCEDQGIKEHFCPNFLSYFREQASGYGENRWGLFCAVLGNAKNKSDFLYNRETHFHDLEKVPGDFERLQSHLFRIDDPGHVLRFFKAIEKDREKFITQGEKIDFKTAAADVLNEILHTSQLERFTSEWQKKVPQMVVNNKALFSYVKNRDWDELILILLKAKPSTFANLLKKTDQARIENRSTLQSKRRKKLLESISLFKAAEGEYYFLVELGVQLRQHDEIYKKSQAKKSKIEETIQTIHIQTNNAKDELDELLDKQKTLVEEIAWKSEKYELTVKTRPSLSWWRSLFGVYTSKYLLHEEKVSNAVSELILAKEQSISLEKDIRAVRQKIDVYTTELSEANQYLVDENGHSKNLLDEMSSIQKQLGLVEKQHIFSQRQSSMESEVVQKASPWGSEQFNMIRSQLFSLALLVNQSIIECMAYTARDALSKWSKIIQVKVQNNTNLADMTSEDRLAAWSWFFLCFPVLSTTCHSVGTLFASIDKQNALGYLLFDEAGQALPYMGIGALYRCRNALVVGDPQQLDPVVTTPNDVDYQLALRRHFLDEKDTHLLQDYVLTATSMQRLSEAASPIQSKNGKVRIGLPLRVHRRCDNPMFNFSNSIAYHGDMIQGKQFVKSTYPNIFQSGWVNVVTEQNSDKNSYRNQNEARAALALVSAFIRAEKKYPSKKETDPLLPIYIITPFRQMALELNKLIKADYQSYGENVKAGTIHTFQGQEAPTVIICLACNKKQGGGASWVTSRPNLLNVAVTRAKRRLFVIGDRGFWNKYVMTDQLAATLPYVDHTELTNMTTLEVDIA